MTMNKPKIALVGAGNIGGTMAHLAMKEGLGHVVLVDTHLDRTQGKALDLMHCSSFERHHLTIQGTDHYEDLEGSDVVIVSAGMARKPGMSRDDLLEINGKIIQTIGEKLKKNCPDAFVIVITNPLDAMVWAMKESTGFPARRVVGMAGTLDGARFRLFLAQELNVNVSDIHTLVLGGHGDEMVPLVGYTTVSGISLLRLVEMGWISIERINSIVHRTRQGGGEIVKLLQTGSAFYTPAACALEIARSYLYDERKIFACASWLEGAYGLFDIYAGVPVIIGKSGVEKVVELPLSSQEREAFDRSVQEVTNLVKKLKTLLVF